MSVEPIVLGGRYQLAEVIGRGGMAEVWRAHDQRLDRAVAVKRLRVDLATDQTFQTRFQREAQAAAGLNHPNIVSVYDTGEKVDANTGIMVPYIVMELVEGSTLRDLLRQGRPIQPEKALEYAMGVLDALSYSHKADIVHRDIKPANVMITPTGQVKVMDFGIARAVSDTSATMTQTAAVIGTAQYLSPEQARGEQVDARSDIYSAGCLLYELLTGRPPFIGDSPVSVAYQHVREMPVPPSQLDAEITPEMDAITMKALAKSTADRYQSAKAMRDDCWRALNGRPVSAKIPAVIAMNETVAIAPTRALPMEEDTQLSAPPLIDDPTEERYYDDEQADEDPEPGERRISPATVVMVGLLVLVLGALGLFAWRLLGPGADENTVQVPGVLGFQQEAAVEQLTLAQLTPDVQHQPGPAEGKGTVVQQNPPGGDMVQVGSTVTIVINDGPPLSTIPTGLVGKQETEAIKLLAEAGFNNVQTLAAPASQDTVNAKKGEVVSVVPDQGEQVSTDQQITLYVASGRTQVPPGLVGKTEAEARDTLEAAGLTNIVSDYVQVTATSPEPGDMARGAVVRTNPSEGETVESGERITLHLATGQNPMPNVSNMDIDQALAALYELGFKNVSQESQASTSPAGQVVSQSVIAGQITDKSAHVVLYVATAAPTTATPSTSASTPSSSPSRTEGD